MRSGWTIGDRRIVSLIVEIWFAFSANPVIGGTFTAQPEADPHEIFR
jgi:hypothetical protein